MQCRIIQTLVILFTLAIHQTIYGNHPCDGLQGADLELCWAQRSGGEIQQDIDNWTERQAAGAKFEGQMREAINATKLSQQLGRSTRAINKRGTTAGSRMKPSRFVKPSRFIKPSPSIHQVEVLKSRYRSGPNDGRQRKPNLNHPIHPTTQDQTHVYSSAYDYSFRKGE
jgi:hypothetical protein